MQTSEQNRPAPATQTPTVVTVGPDGQHIAVTIPVSRQEIRELLVRREELSNQLTSVSARRSELAGEIRATPDEATRVGLQDRLKLLDQRILQLESDIAATGSQLAAAPATLVAETRSSDNTADVIFEPILLGGAFMLLGALAVYFIQRRRLRRRHTPAPITSNDSARLERLEQGMEAIAIEVERISEGQRFVTRLLAETQGPTVKRVPEEARIKTPV